MAERRRLAGMEAGLLRRGSRQLSSASVARVERRHQLPSGRIGSGSPSSPISSSPSVTVAPRLQLHRHRPASRPRTRRASWWTSSRPCWRCPGPTRHRLQPRGVVLAQRVEGDSTDVRSATDGHEPIGQHARVHRLRPAVDHVRVAGPGLPITACSPTRFDPSTGRCARRPSSWT